MESHEQSYWPQVINVPSALLELRSQLAWDLLVKFGIIAGKPSLQYDPAGRATITLLEPLELVERAFNIADAFVNMAHTRKEIRANIPVEELARKQGELAGITQTASLDGLREFSRK